MAGLGSTYPPRSARPPSPNLKPNELKIGNKPGVNILVVTAKGCGTRNLRKYGCGSVLRLDREKSRAWLCEESSPGVCIGLNHTGFIMPERGVHSGRVCSLQEDLLQEGHLGECVTHGVWGARESLGRAKMGGELTNAVRAVWGKSHDTMYWNEQVGEQGGEFTSFAPDSGVFSTVEHSGATTLQELDDLQLRVRDHEYSYVPPFELKHDEGPPSSDSPPDFNTYTGGRKPRGRKRRTRRTRGRRRRRTYKRKRRVRRRGTRRR